MAEYHVDMLPQFKDIVYESGKKGNFGGWFSVRMKLVERPVICLGQDKATFKHYIFANKKWDHIVNLNFGLKYKEYDVTFCSNVKSSLFKIIMYPDTLVPPSNHVYSTSLISTLPFTLAHNYHLSLFTVRTT